MANEPSEIFEKFSAEALITIDGHIYENQIIEAMTKIQETLNVNLHIALQILHSRYNHLRSLQTDHFIVSDKDYWKGFYS